MASGLDDEGAASKRGLAYCRPTTDTMPRELTELRKTPVRTAGGTGSSLKLACFGSARHPHVIQSTGDPNYLTLVWHSGGARIWRDLESTPAEPGSIGMHPFEPASFRFDGSAHRIHAYVPFALLGTVSECVFDRQLTHAHVWIPMGARDARFSNAMLGMQSGLFAVEPTNLILDSWALILSEIVLRRFSIHAGNYVRPSFGKLPPLGLARVVDYVEANLDRDLHLGALASVAAMGVYHFARRFKETVGVNPHAYVLARRIRRAQAMLKHGDHRLADVAAACGFSGQPHFTTVFQRSIGVTPGEYRRRLAL